eukprot:349674-Chlamydomonas_euryale.AAC.7
MVLAWVPRTHPVDAAATPCALSTVARLASLSQWEWAFPNWLFPNWLDAILSPAVPPSECST